ncbi:PAS domain S-box protein [Ginsengibacter hankyongi]|uniref:histidine kinase n=1 Tax=Ginsengibacter hankyongi TaxID=2607284 RepID=A0A5J5IJD6_9BACT|nr:PAS domain S-box protein [Ginsengibacter hankyongi]KAA9040493.1 PAS domain S-box protein [Ginsengibacter hankyongi]
MPPYLKILVLENNEADVTRTRSVLQQAKINFEVKAVDSKATFIAALDNFHPDVILANHCVKHFDAIQALELKNEKKYNVPFILVTDSVSEIFAAKIIKFGADDYLLKKDLSFLPGAIESALQQEKYISPKVKESELLQKSLSRNTSFLNAIPDLIFVMDRHGVFTDFQPSRDIEAYTRPEHFLGKKCTEILPAQLAADTLQNIATVLQGGTLPIHEYQMVYPDGIHEFEARYAAISESEVLTIVRDITLQKKFAQKIIKEKAVSESIINSLPGIFYMFSEDGKFLRWNKNFEKVTEYTGEEINNMQPLSLIDTNEKPKMERTLARVFEMGEDTVEANILSKSGKKTFFFFTGQKIEYEGQQCIAGVGIDLSERKMAEEALARNEEKFRTLVEQATDGITIADQNYRFTEINGQFCKITGYSREELLHMKMTDLPLVRPENLDVKYKALKEGESVITERLLKRKNGNTVLVEINATLLPNGYYLSFVRNIKERKKNKDLLEGEKEVMEMIAIGKPLKEILHTIALNYESICENTICSILLINKEGSQLLHGAGPSLPPNYNNSIDGTFIGAEAGSCGTAAFKKQRIIVPNIASDPLWANYRHLALQHGLKSCWSSPIFDKGNKVLATFAIYSREARNPGKEELKLIDRATNMVRIALERYTNEIELKEREEKFRILVERVSDAFVALDTNWNYIYVNKKAGELLGRDPEYLVGKNIWKEFPQSIGKPFHLAYTRAMKEQRQITLSEYFPTFDKWFENNLYPSPEGLSVYFKDITQQKVTEQKIVKSNRLYYFLSQFNQMIVYAGNEKTLFKEACKIAVNIGKFRMAWVGIINEKTLDLEPFVYDGMERGYLSEITVKADHSRPEGQGPSGTSIAKGKTVTCNDIETDPKMALWKSAALKRNYHSNIGLPIKKFGKVIGVFTLYADAKNFFDEEEIALLEGATRNISFALEVFEKEAMQKLAEEEIIKSNKQFQNLVENISGVYWVNNLDTHETLYISPSYETIWGRKCEDIYSNPDDFIDAVHPDDKEQVLDTYQTICKTPTINITYRIIRPDGNIRWIAAKIKIVVDSGGNKLEYGYAEDITEKKIVESELAESENRLKTILQNEPECVKLLDEKGNLLDMNPAGLAMIEADNLEMVKGKKMTNIINKPYIATFAELIENVFKGSQGKMEFEITGLKGTHRWLETHAVPLKNAAGEIISLLGVTRDITDRKVAEENEKELTQKVLKGAEIAHFGFIDWNLVTNEMNLSQQANEIYGISEEHLDYAAFIDKIVHPEDVMSVHANVELALQSVKDYNIDHRIVCPDGSIKWVNARGELYRDEAGKPMRMFGTILDITDNKNAELQIKIYNDQLRLLTNHLQNIREEERNRIGREIHDELGQQLTAIKMDVSWIHKNTTDKKEAINIKLKNIIALLDGSNQSVRKILSELRPGILDNNGLSEAMEWHAKQFTATTNIPVVITNSEKDLKFHEDIATCIFRIFQESLTNIMRYAHAKNVLISLNVINKEIIMDIQDNGIGFDASSVQGRKTFGILGMRERVRSLDGEFELTSARGKGTKISIRLPYMP